MKQTIQFQQIKANTLVNASAIFVGTNQTGNWSSHEKENYLLTIHGHQTYVVNNINIIEDKDLIDTVINDQDTAISMPRHTENVSLTFDDINTNTMQDASGVFVGDIDITGLDSHFKVNEGIGDILSGENIISGNMNIQHDEDYIDGIINDQDNKAMTNIKAK